MHITRAKKTRLSVLGGSKVENPFTRTQRISGGKKKENLKDFGRTRCCMGFMTERDKEMASKNEPASQAPSFNW